MTHWQVRIGDGVNHEMTLLDGLWGADSTKQNPKYFLDNVKPGDFLWFILSGKNVNGRIKGVATFVSQSKRESGPLVELYTNEDVGWRNWNGDTLIHYSNYYGLYDCELLTHIKGQSSYRVYNEKCRVDLPLEYSNILRYSKITLL